MNWKTNTRVHVTLGLITVFLLQYTQGLVDFSLQVGHPITPWLLPFQLSGRWCRLIVYGGAILFFCNILKRNDYHKYQYLRCGYKVFLFSRIIYIVISSLLYVFIFIFLTIIPRIPNIAISDTWGKVIGTWSIRTSLQTYAGIPGSTYIIDNYSYIEGMIYSSLFLWITLCILAMIIYLFDIVFGRIWGAIMGGLLIGIDCLTQMITIPSIQAFAIKISPLSWSNINFLENINMVQSIKYPSVQYAFSAGIGLLVGLMFIVYLLVKKTYVAGSKRQIVRLLEV